MGHTEKSSRKPRGAQVDRFREKARELGCDEDEAAFDDRLKRLAKQRQKDEKVGVPKFDDEAVKRAEQKMPRNWRDD